MNNDLKQNNYIMSFLYFFKQSYLTCRVIYAAGIIYNY
jgi:hypothetical protein